MNRNPDGSLLTVEQLESMARTALAERGVTEDVIESRIAEILGHGSTNMIRSDFNDITAELRARLHGEGILTFRTELREIPPPVKVTIPSDIMEWITQQRKEGTC